MSLILAGSISLDSTFKRRKKVRMSECAHVCRSLLARTVAEGVTAFSTEATLVSPKHIGRKRNF
jgi:hypothetical protein